MDLISRQAAIDAVDKCTSIYINNLPAMVDKLEIRKALLELPSVTPDIIACGDCKHWICHDRRCEYWNHGVKPLEWCCHAERRPDERID